MDKKPFFSTQDKIIMDRKMKARKKIHELLEESRIRKEFEINVLEDKNNDR